MTLFCFRHMRTIWIIIDCKIFTKLMVVQFGKSLDFKLTSSLLSATAPRIFPKYQIRY
jgi:hypothetical protein